MWQWSTSCRWPTLACCGPGWSGRRWPRSRRRPPLPRPTLRQWPGSDDDEPAGRGVPAAAAVCAWHSHVAVRWSAPPISLHDRGLGQDECASSRSIRVARPVRDRSDGKLEFVLITGFPAGLLQCNCYVLAPHPGADAIVVDPGQRAMGQLRRILDKNRLTPAAVLLTHGHIDHIWSAQKVSDTYGFPAYIHPEDRFMLTDPIKDFGPKLGQLLLAAIFREPKQVIELDRDGDKIDLAGISITVDHTPGHTRGSVVFRASGAKDAKDVVFTGDTLFERSVGRTDLFGDSGRDL